MKHTCIIDTLDFPESPFFDSGGGLWLTELNAGNLVSFRHGVLHKYQVGTHVNGAVADGKDNIWFTDSATNRIGMFNIQTKQACTACHSVEGDLLKRPNDLAFDRRGNLIVTCHADGRQEPSGYLICINTHGRVNYIAKKKYFPNGIAFSADGYHFIYSETYRQRLWKAIWDPEHQQIRHETPWALTSGPIGPDGMAFDENGLLYVAIFDQGKISVFDRQGGQEIRSYALPAARPTSCAFDPSGMLGLVVTEAQKGQVLSIPLKQKGLLPFKRA